ncbi:MAG: 3-hydroxyacyl-[acyl-carrier-protein] dehydratase FabZ [Alphaproteobacteria bacterium]|nr:MAG: 3-hydroxyacyl-[acyl-carrier-protein] dehydratase FabZ [Alphaproteobacteria bacterium]TAF15599.1 MAG: 3-hydroxyacyl-[acyl-carrier-protein] dehydratase FabZ [Alphaproteobacteria bacterium]TAF42003.1 MAG: 3-hydroxyacyl-[acyl-carrier-protein] dehydratase FabZ [Alphaproteobacteria bacterium]TAF76611.1 MAG: 3-hydroxyacyl-[acyl-carrier-protein] dehydratase FabZ [Alphaproteobacteria bacterium]
MTETTAPESAPWIIDTGLDNVGHERVKDMIPHRFPFLMVDKVVNLQSNISGLGIKNVSAGEPCFAGHFPDQAVFPGVLIVEAMAQTAGVLVVYTLGKEAEGKLVYFMTVDSARFRKLVVPGDQLRVYVRVVRSRGNVWKFIGDCYVEGVKVAEAEFSAMIVDKPHTDASS